MTLSAQPLDQSEWLLRQPDFIHRWKYSIYTKQGDGMVRVAVVSGEPGQAQEHTNALAIAGCAGGGAIYVALSGNRWGSICERTGRRRGRSAVGVGGAATTVSGAIHPALFSP